MPSNKPGRGTRRHDGELRGTDGPTAAEPGKVYRFHSQEMMVRAKVRLMLQRSLRSAMENRELSLAFQPVVRLSDGAAVGFEALLRWHHPQAGMVPPEVFIPLLEECGLLLQVGSWVIDQVCQQIHGWRHQGLLPEGFRVSVNVSPRQFASAHFIPQLLGTLSRWSVTGSDLELELTQSPLAGDAERGLSRMRELKAHGLSFAIDEVGSSLPAMDWLEQGVVDRLKLGRCFVQHSVDSDQDRAICEAVIALALRHALCVVAVGVETEAQSLALQALGCELGQGFGFERPMPQEQATDYLRGNGRSHGIGE